MSRFWSPLAASLEPYVPGEQPKDKQYIKLNTNENPYPPSPRVKEAIESAVNADLRLYPDPGCADLRQTAAECYGVLPEQVFVGNGSDEVLAFAFAAFFDPARILMFPDITYSFYPVYASFYGLQTKTPPLADDFTISVSDYIQKDNKGGIIVPNPNAPTAVLLPLDAIRSILDANPDVVVIIDEAYVDFGGTSAVELIASYPNLLVIHTLSKSRSLAGLRVGMAFGQTELIEGLERVKNSFNSYTLDRLALAGAAAALEDKNYFEQTTAKVIATRERVAATLTQMGFVATDSKANFVFASHPQFEAKFLFEQLRANGVLVRYFSKPRIDSYLRITIGTDEEMDVLLEQLEKLVN